MLTLHDFAFSGNAIALYAYVHRAEDSGFDLAGFQALRDRSRRIEARPGHVSIAN